MMAKLVDVFRNDTALGRRQLPLIIDENLTMVMDLNSMGLVCDNTNVRGKELDDITEKLKLLTPYELKAALKVSILDIRNVLDQAVPCVGCRRSVERLFFQILRSGFPTLDPIVITKGGILTVRGDKIKNPNVLCNLFHGHATRLNNLVDSQPRSKKSRRCLLHSLESQRPRPVTPAWRDVWDCMRAQCKDEVVLIEASSLHATLENYLRKHRFCGECRTKVLRAYTLLVEEPDPCKEKGYVASLYSGIKRCIPDKHLHLQTKTDYIANLIVRAEPEIMGSRRERHAKTLEIAQEEVLTCLGICIYERLHRIYMRLREEECTCQVLAAVAVNCLCRSFETAVEVKRGFTRLEQLYEELTREEQLKVQRKENKKLKRRRKKERKDEKEMSNESLDLICDSNCLCGICDNKTTKEEEEEEEEEEDEEEETTPPFCQCDSVKLWSSSEQDCGYSSENNNCESSLPSSPEGSEVACSDGFCNHEGHDRQNHGLQLTLAEMLSSSDEDGEEASYISAEEVLEFKSKVRHLTEKRQELRQTLKTRFAQLCFDVPSSQPRIRTD